MKEENWHRRHAVMLASQLPEGTEDALAVLRLATELVTGFLSGPSPMKKPATVVRIGATNAPDGAPQKIRLDTQRSKYVVTCRFAIKWMCRTQFSALRHISLTAPVRPLLLGPLFNRQRLSNLTGPKNSDS